MTRVWSLILFFSICGRVMAQDSLSHAQPIEGISPDSITFYDRLDQELKGRRLNYDNKDSSFNWMVGSWSIKAKGYARNGFRGKKEFEWQEPYVAFTSDQNYSIYVSTNDTIRQTGRRERKLVPMPPQVILQYDVYSNVWVLQSGYYNRYDWGSLVSSGWTGDQIVFEGAISLTGIRLVERETWTKQSDDAFRIVYEELMNDGTWFTIEENTYTRTR
ncbi:MAG TPA: hypothetical protein VG605_09740 [Puia sp.]|nr:hypothetical protein [Puia sp.]